MNEFSIRLGAVVWGVILIGITFLLGKELKNTSAGLWSAFWIALMPWAIHYSRFGVTYSCYASLFSLGILFWLKSKKHPPFWIHCGISFGLCAYSYTVAYFMVPITIFFLMLYSLFDRIRPLFNQIWSLFSETWPAREKKYFYLATAVFILFFIPIIHHLVFGEGLARWKQIGLSNPSITDWSFLHIAARQYFHQFSLEFFLGNADIIHNFRHFIGEFRPLLPILIPFALLGTLYGIFKKRILLVWLFLYPLGGTFTQGGPFTGRSVIGAPLFALLAGIGIVVLFEQIISKKKSFPFIRGPLPTFTTIISLIFFLKTNVFFSTLAGVLIVGALGKLISQKKILQKIQIPLLIFLISISFIKFAHYYAIQYPLISSGTWGWQFGPREILKNFNKVEDDYDQLVLDHPFNAPEIFLKFYPLNDLKKYRVGDHQIWDKNIRQIFSLAPYQIEQAKEMGLEIKPLKLIVYPGGKPAFVIAEIESQK